jgi:DNA replication protein DnaD
MNNGWIKLHRKLIDKAFFKRPQYLVLWVYLLLIANHAEKEFMWNGNIIIVKEGQLITGRKELSAQTGIPESTIEDILKFLESQQQIQQQKTTKYRLITILNWETYQGSNTKSNNRATTEQQQADTNKNDKKVKNDKNNYGEFKNVLLSEDEYRSLCSTLSEPIVQTLIAELDEYIESKGVKYASHRATIQSWARRRINDHATSLKRNKAKIAFI